MKTIVLFIFSCYSFSLCAQSNDSTYLFYEKIIDKYKNEQGQTTLDTTFLFSGLVFKTKSYSFSKGFNAKKEKIVIGRSGKSITLIRGNETKIGIIVYDSILSLKDYKNIQFFLVPIARGVKLPSIKGQLIWGNKDFMGKIIPHGLNLGNSTLDCSIYERMSPSINCGKLKYGDASHCNIFYDESLLTYFQPTRIISDSVFLVNSFFSFLRKGDIIKKNLRLINKILPQKNMLNEIQNNLQGNWNFVKGSVYKSASLENESLKGFSFNLSFVGSKLIVERNFYDEKYKNFNDTLKYSINPSGDYLVIEDQKPANHFQPIIIIKNCERF